MGWQPYPSDGVFVGALWTDSSCNRRPRRPPSSRVRLHSPLPRKSIYPYLPYSPLPADLVVSYLTLDAANRSRHNGALVLTGLSSHLVRYQKPAS